MSQDNENIADSIITLSKEPVKELSSIMININDYLQYLEKAPFIAKPFVRKDLSAVTDMDVKELYNLLNRIKESLEKIDKAASLIKDKRRYRKYIFNERFSRARKEEKPTKPSKVEPEKPSEEKREIIYFYCPECGHKCKGQNGLKIHVRIKHKEKEEEILKIMKLYDK